jgi:cytochrome c oxidase subunit 1
MSAADATRTDDNLSNILTDAGVGVVAGAAGTALMTLILYSAFRAGAAGGSIERLGSLVYLDAVLPQPLAGFVTFAVGGIFFWPLVFASLEPRIPGDDRTVKGAVFAMILWTGFLVGFFRTDAGSGFALYALYTGAAHLIYGVALGGVFGRFVSDEHEERVAQLGSVSAGEGASAAGPESGSEAETPPTLPDDDAQVVVFEGEDDLPPLLQFGDAIRRIEEGLSGEYGEFDRLREEYDAMTRRGQSNRPSLVSSIRYAVTGLETQIHAREDEADAERIQKWLDSINNRADQYLATRSNTSGTLHISGFAFDRDGESPPVAEMQGEEVGVRATVVNQGEASGAVITVDFYPADEDVLLRSVDLSVGHLPAGGSDSIDTTVHVPSIAESYEARVSDPRDGQQFLPDF